VGEWKDEGESKEGGVITVESEALHKGDQETVQPRRRIVPLVNFESQVSLVDFGEGVYLSLLSDNEANHILGHPFLSAEFSYWNRRTTRFKLELRYECQRHPQLGFVAEPPPASIQRLRNVFVALRLHKKGDVGAPIFIDFDTATDPPREWGTGGFSSVQRMGLAYSLNDSDVPEILQLIAQLDKAGAKNDRNLEIALLRFSDTYGRNRGEDAIVDGFIALETCLTPDSTMEVGYRLSLRGAALLAGTMPAAEARALLNLGYDARSRLVHRGWSLRDLFNDKSFEKSVRRFKETTGATLLPENFADAVIETVRLALRRIVAVLASEPEGIKAMNDRLDDTIANAVGRFGRLAD
jgi:hypothetical protein